MTPPGAGYVEKPNTHTHTILCGYTMYYMCTHLDDFILFWFLFYRFFPFCFLHFSNDLPTTFQSFPLAAAGGPWSGSARGTTLAALWCWECLESKMRGGMLGFLGIAWCLTSKMLRVFFLRKTISLNRVFHGHFRGFWKWDAWRGIEIWDSDILFSTYYMLCLDSGPNFAIREVVGDNVTRCISRFSGVFQSQTWKMLHFPLFEWGC